jgi:hypothetical protein
MSILITPEDIGRKFTTRNGLVGEILHFLGASYLYPVETTLGSYTKKGQYLGFNDDERDIVECLARPTYFDLFTHMSEEHGLILLNEDLREIVRICQAMKKDTPPTKEEE